ncbi:universal stress protein [Acidianus sulfidivorans JP7]|uniref:Universal stress protein n=1 Tax=Acidianus sulfidivorans JP7 TaxID=619593 RepID=A0A2U9INF6_9CREN|nr:universal stress protein [Acidianus sulfidivorans]AWR97532.1 universal stress protein [Acidianus sulfidivorans JP7]
MKVILAYDGSDYSKKAVFFSLRFLKKEEDEIHIVTVVKEAPKSPEQRIIESEEKAKELLDSISSETAGFNVKTKILESNDVADAIIDYCKQINCDLVITGSRGLTGLKKAIMGSVSSALVSKADFPVLVVK